jgi:FdrA protein
VKREQSIRYEIRPGAYYDSVVLMQLQRSLAALPGVVDAGVVMATPANRDLLASSGLLPSETARAGNDDLLIVVKAETEEAATAALSQVDALIKQRRSTTGQSYRPRSLAAAAKQLPEAGWVSISVPGRYAAGVAREALDLNKHVFLYSDNVPLADEVALKETAREKGLLLMGPDCGTAIINGVGLGFANRVRRGRIGLVGASGTGLQLVSSQIHQQGAGVSQAIGTGSRDLSPEVGGITARQGLAWLARDPETAVIVLISKPPHPDVARGLLAAAQQSGKPVVVQFIGYPVTMRRLENIWFATSLHEAAELAVQLLGETAESGADNADHTAANSQNGRYLRGLFSGGTLAYEALLSLQTSLAPLYSNVPVRPEQQLADLHQSQAHTILDLGEDEFTQGRLHPMMDNDLRLRRLRQETADPDVGVILLDVVLGEGAHPDPAAELAPVIADLLAAAQKEGRSLNVLALLVGTDDDPQDLAAQAEQLQAAGATVFYEMGTAVARINRHLGQTAADDYPLPALATGQAGLAAINVGLESFYDSLTGQGAAAVHVDWRPPAGGNEKMMALLARMKQSN